MDTQTKIVIIGAGHGGTAAAMELRKRGYIGQVILLNAETGDPYERPPLSKAWLTNDDSRKPTLANAEMFISREIEFHQNMRVTKINRAEKTLTCENGTSFSYDYIILAMGGLVRELPITGITASNVHALRFAKDAERLRSALSTGGHIGVIGAGYIGLEVAASARKLGLDVTIIELADRCMKRTASPELSEFYETYHREQGVNFVFNAGVEEIVTDGETAKTLKLSNGQQIACDHILLAAGGVPDISLAVEAGLDQENGIIVDEDARTSDPHIFAIGDITQRPSIFADTTIRLESVGNANEQAKLAAAAILEQDRPAPEAPWFWSDQYDLKLQIAGLIRGNEDRIVRNEGAPNKFAVYHYNGEKLNAVEAVNAPIAYMATRKALGMGKTLDRSIVSDPQADLRKAIS